jgi:hypothetical protein
MVARRRARRAGGGHGIERSRRIYGPFRPRRNRPHRSPRWCLSRVARNPSNAGRTRRDRRSVHVLAVGPVDEAPRGTQCQPVLSRARGVGLVLMIELGDDEDIEPLDLGGGGAFGLRRAGRHVVPVCEQSRSVPSREGRRIVGTKRGRRPRFVKAQSRKIRHAPSATSGSFTLAVLRPTSARRRLPNFRHLALLAQTPEGGVERLVRAAEARGAGRAAAQAILLCRRLLGTPLPAPLVAALGKRQVVRWLEATALSAMTTGQGEGHPHKSRFGTTRGSLSTFLLSPSWCYQLAELKTHFINQTDVLTVALPKQLLFLYPMLRPLLCRGS